MEGAMRSGTLKDAKIVTLSRRQKSIYEVLGILAAVFAAVTAAAATGLEDSRDDGVAGDNEEGDGPDEGPNIFANLASLYTHIDMFTAVVVTNFAVPGVTVENDWFRRVEVTVSMVLAVR
jgi:hypothetical protein